MNYLKKELYDLIKKDDQIFDFIQRSALDGMWYWDLDNMEEEWMNDKFWSTLGYNGSKMPNKAASWQNIINHDDLKLALDNFEKHKADPSYPYDQIVRYTHYEGHTVWIRCRGLIIRDENNEPKRMLGAHTDVTELKKSQIEAQELLDTTIKQNERLINFSHIVSHNLKSHSINLTTLLGFGKNKHPDLFETEIFKMIESASESLETTINHLNEVASINTNQNLELVNKDICGFLEKSVAGIYGDLSSSNARIEINFEEEVWASVIPAYMDSVILNLLTNAIKYRSKDRGLLISINAFYEGDRAVFTVSDNGMGIDLEKYGDQVFSMYKVFHDHPDARGIGLFISKNQVEAMKGAITVASEPNIGTTFKIELNRA